MEFLIILIAPLIIYVIAMFVVTNITVDKLGARSGLFGSGIVTMFMGFIMHNLTKEHYRYYGRFDLTPMYYVLCYGFLIMGLTGIVMIAVDLLKAVNELSDYASRVDEKQSALQKNLCSSEKIPTWKRVQADQQEKSYE